MCGGKWHFGTDARAKPVTFTEFGVCERKEKFKSNVNNKKPHYGQEGDKNENPCLPRKYCSTQFIVSVQDHGALSFLNFDWCNGNIPTYLPDVSKPQRNLWKGDVAFTCCIQLPSKQYNCNVKCCVKKIHRYSVIVKCAYIVFAYKYEWFVTQIDISSSHLSFLSKKEVKSLDDIVIA